jgi:cytochrome P450
MQNRKIRCQGSIHEALASWGSYDRDNPFPLFAQLRDLAPVHRVTLADGHAAWLVLRYHEARIALNDPRLSKDMQAALATSSEVVAEGIPGPAFSRHMLNVDPPDHTRLRRLVSAAFSHRRIEELRPRIQAIVDDLLDRIAEHGPESRVDLIATFAFPLPFTVICELLGVPDAHQATLGSNLTTLLSPTTTPEAYERAVRASDGVVGYLAALVDAKRNTTADDLVTALINARDGEARLTNAELLSTIFQLIVAGHDTTTSLIGNGTVALLLHPDQLAALRADPRRIPDAVEELLRYDAPVPHSTFRYATEPVDLGGVTIPAGEQVIICLAAANRDSDHFAEPDTLNLNRSDTRHLAFAHGIHFCLGAALARMEAHSRSPHCSIGSPISASPSRPHTCTGDTATASCSEDSPNYPYSPDQASPGAEINGSRHPPHNGAAGERGECLCQQRAAVFANRRMRAPVLRVDNRSLRWPVEGGTTFGTDRTNHHLPQM